MMKMKQEEGDLDCANFGSGNSNVDPYHRDRLGRVLKEMRREQEVNREKVEAKEQ